MAKKKLPTLSSAPEALGLRTIMDRALAQRYGVPYVHLVVFAIDIDRVFHEVDDESLPLGWEVFITERYLLGELDVAEDSHRSLVEDTCISVMERSEEAPVLGSQLPFAVYDAVHRGEWPADAFSGVFTSWRKPPAVLLASLRGQFAVGGRSAELAGRCLAKPLTPPLAPTTRNALEAMMVSSESDSA